MTETEVRSIQATEPAGENVIIRALKKQGLDLYRAHFKTVESESFVHVYRWDPAEWLELESELSPVGHICTADFRKGALHLAGTNGLAVSVDTSKNGNIDEPQNSWLIADPCLRPLLLAPDACWME